MRSINLKLNTKLKRYKIIMNINNSFSNLYTLLINNGFNSKLLYNNNINPLKKIKTIFNNDYIPELLYLDKQNIIIFETKTNNLNNINFYKNNINIKKYNIFGITFKNDDDYIIYKLENNNLNSISSKIKPYLLDKDSNFLDMNKEIHKVHNYIRDYTKISNEDKAFFIAIILISIKKASFQYIFDKYKKKEFIYDILLDNLKDYDIDIQVFKFLKSDENNIHLYNLIDMIYKIYNKNPSIDLLNEFYSEFVKYNNSDGKKLGIVLTPPHIVQLMTELLTINNNDTVLDLCTGTGSFLLEANKYNPKNLIGCEYQTKLFALLKCNMILRDITNCKLIKGDCFKQQFKATKSLINPPYGNKSETEYNFIIKQLESLDEEGECCAIIPVSRLNNNKLNNNFKEKIMNLGIIKNIIICRNTLFYPYAFIQCCIIHIKKTTKKHNEYTNIINYTNDGFELIKQNGLVKTKEYDELYLNLKNMINSNKYQTKLKYDDDWHVFHEKKVLLIDLNSINLYKLELNYQQQKQNLLLTDDNIKKIIDTKNILLIDIFTIEKNKIRFIKDNKNNNGKYNLISATKLNNGIVKNIDIYDYKRHCLTLSDLGAECSCFYQFNEFSITNHIFVLRSKKDISIDKYILYAHIIEKTIKDTYYMFRNINTQILNKLILTVPIELLDE
jgi:type I restriction-modification system DNA methylase subunit